MTTWNTALDEWTEISYAGRRAAMVEEQLRQRGISDPRVLAAMAEVPRHHFVPRDIRALAYSDRALPIGHGQTISQPLMVAIMLQETQLRPTDRVLDVGTGSGYQAALLSRLVGHVRSVEIVPELVERARAELSAEQCSNVHVALGDGRRGWPSEAPFDAIVVAAAAEGVPPALVMQLARGGRLLIPLVTRYGQSLFRLVRQDDRVVSEDLGACVFVPLVGH